MRYEEEFKEQIVKLYNNGKPANKIMEEYDISSSTLYRWIKNYNKTGSFKAKDNRTKEENELIELRKKVKQLEMENDILKQAALIIGKKSK